MDDAAAVRKRKRPHPARRARRIAGAASGLSLLVMTGVLVAGADTSTSSATSATTAATAVDDDTATAATADTESTRATTQSTTATTAATASTASSRAVTSSRGS
jgi:hypothetical protein